MIGYVHMLTNIVDTGQCVLVYQNKLLEPGKRVWGDVQTIKGLPVFRGFPFLYLCVIKAKKNVICHYISTPFLCSFSKVHAFLSPYSLFMHAQYVHTIAYHYGVLYGYNHRYVYVPHARRSLD